ncbi:MAG TPA: AzlC family ABC transporter permease [Candidatus Pullichristensenella excrementigallinarum]|uniref:AzlC family ABC transporter permease n=1 Tax=Candidatus Pullichristensenella excrementigallinarum TaxID=2840907 RepID=A0A9D1ICM3_9FIRM|nr:AzlC family ABC transporter permease [Candidatus Pullichristensenella excrementigallinarum]
MPGIWKFSFRQSSPILPGYLFLGLAFGVLLREAGYSWFWAPAASTLVYAGSMQFVLVSLLREGAPLALVAVTTLLVNARHLFYGLGFLDRYRQMGWKGWYMALALTDETYSVLCVLDPPKGMSWGECAFWITLLDHLYWIAGSVLGAVVGGLLPVDAAGIDFSMTALFVVIFLEQWKALPNHIPALTGLGCAILSLLLFGADNFLLPALAAAVVLLTILRGEAAK